MIFLIHGQDKNKLLAKTAGLLKILLDKRPDAEIFEMRSGEWDDADVSLASNHLSAFIANQGLFEKKLIIVFKNLCTESAKAREFIIDRIDDLKGSQNVFVFSEEKIDAKTLAILKRSAQKVIEADQKNERADSRGFENDYNFFDLSDAFGERNKEKIWAIYEKALMRGKEPEELHGIIFWQLKSMLFSIGAATAEKSGLKPFVFSKSKKFAKNYNERELRELSGKMVRLYHQSRIESGNLATALEKFLLEI